MQKHPPPPVGSASPPPTISFFPSFVYPTWCVTGLAPGVTRGTGTRFPSLPVATSHSITPWNPTMSFGSAWVA